MARLRAPVREKAAFEIGGLLREQGQITEEQAAQAIAEANDINDWDSLSWRAQQYYRRCASGMLTRLAGPGMAIFNEKVWKFLKPLEPINPSIPETA